ncbi:MAG: SDR family oxidoreductase [Burkholderiales bacterium]|nr:SDR family oxidoreductase [Burkholderiales bacterium]
MTETCVTVVTGANRGIGLEIARQLAKRPGIHVVLTARDEMKGQAAAERLREDGLDVEYHRLDVTDPASVGVLSRHVARTHGRCDILVNNAGISIESDGTRIVDSKLAEWQRTLDTNLLGPLRLAQALLPLMRKHRYGRIVNVSSRMGQLASMGTGAPAYRVSKAALNALTAVLAAEAGRGILVNTMTPGWVRTDMGGAGAPRSVAEGADTAVWLATLPENGPTGGFFMDRKRIAW